MQEVYVQIFPRENVQKLLMVQDGFFDDDKRELFVGWSEKQGRHYLVDKARIISTEYAKKIARFYKHRAKVEQLKEALHEMQRELKI